jgi:hypothetical protein
MRYLVRVVREREHFLPDLTAGIPGLEIMRDFSRDAMTTFLYAMTASQNDPTVHLEDDIILTRDFTAKVEAEIDKNPGQVIQFFSIKRSDARLGSREMPGRSFIMTQCFYLPAGHAPAIHAYRPGWRRAVEHPTGFDLMVADFLGDRRERYWLHVPSLVQHRPIRSEINPRRPVGRQSETFLP